MSDCDDSTEIDQIKLNNNNEIFNTKMLTADVKDFDQKDDNTNFINCKKFSPLLSKKFTYLNEDLNLFGNFKVLECIKGDICVNLKAVANGVEELLRLYREKVKMLDDYDDRMRLSDSDSLLLKKLLSRKTQEYENVSADCTRLRDSINDIRKELRQCNKQLNAEKNNVKVVNSNIARERTQSKNEKMKLERELVALKERMNKLLTDPKKSYSSIEFINTELPFKPIKTVQKRELLAGNRENEINEELITSFRRQLSDVILENRQLREQLVVHLTKLKQLAYCHEDFMFEESRNQRNNNGVSRRSSGSNHSIKSNETFVVSPPKSEIDERLYLEMPFEMIKDDLSRLFNDNYASLNRLLKNIAMPDNECNISLNNTSSSSQLIDSASLENISRLQKEIFQLRSHLIDYESIIQGKDSLLELAIEQRIRRGSLLPQDKSLILN